MQAYELPEARTRVIVQLRFTEPLVGLASAPAGGRGGCQKALCTSGLHGFCFKPKVSVVDCIVPIQVRRPRLAANAFLDKPMKLNNTIAEARRLWALNRTHHYFKLVNQLTPKTHVQRPQLRQQQGSLMSPQEELDWISQYMKDIYKGVDVDSWIHCPSPGHDPGSTGPLLQDWSSTSHCSVLGAVFVDDRLILGTSYNISGILTQNIATGAAFFKSTLRLFSYGNKHAQFVNHILPQLSAQFFCKLLPC